MSLPVSFPQDIQLTCDCGCLLSKKTSDILTCYTEGCRHFGQEFWVPRVSLTRLEHTELPGLSDVRPAPQPHTYIPTMPPSENQPPLTYLRQTGRTRKMLEKANLQLLTGVPVTVVALKQEQVQNLQAFMRQCFPATAGQLKFICLAGKSLDLETLRMSDIGGPVRTEGSVLFDHYVLESRAAKLLQELHAYDPPVTLPVPDWRKESQS